MGHTFYLTFRDLFGLEPTYTSRNNEGWWSGSWRKSELSFKAITPWETIKVSSGNERLIHSDGERAVSSLRGGCLLLLRIVSASSGKKDSSEFRGLIP